MSVAVPMRNEEAALPALLDSLLAQSVAPAEIVLADGGSTDRTVEVARRYAPRGVRVVEGGPAYPGRGRNLAIAAARHDWVALVDAGCRADPRWLEALLDSVVAAPDAVRVVFGLYEPAMETEWDRAQAWSILAPKDPRTGCRGPTTAACLLHRSAWTAAGGFREDLRAAEDLVFFEKLAAAGIAAAYNPRAVVQWTMAASPRAAFRRLRLYSAHHAAAGLAGTWHRRVMIMDVVGAGLIVAGGSWPPLWGAAAVIALARLLKTVHDRRGNVPDASPYRPFRLARVAALLLLADAAVWAGLLDRRETGAPGA